MGQLSTSAAVIETTKEAFRVTKTIVATLFLILGRGWRIIRDFLRVKIPFIEAFFQRHATNPATVYVDLAVLILVVYLCFGGIGSYLVYTKKSESRFTEALTILYPIPAARVDNSYIWSHRFIQRLRFLNTFNVSAPSEIQSRPPTDSELRKKVLAGLIEDTIIYKEARRLNISVSSEELQQTYDAQKSQVTDFEKKIDQLYGMNPSQFKEILAERLLKEKVKAAVLTRVKIRHVLVSTPSAASEAKKQLSEGKDFSEVAKQFSQDAKTKDSGGELGYWTKGELASQISQPFEDVAFSLSVNVVSDPIQTQFGLHIIQITERAGTELLSYDSWYAEALKKYSVTEYVSTG